MNESSLVNFVGQSKTRFDDSPVFEFKICGAMKVKVYTGDLVKLDCVDAIVCAVDENFTGGLVNAVAKAGGQTYKKDLMYASRYVTTNTGPYAEWMLMLGCDRPPPPPTCWANYFKIIKFFTRN